MEIVDLWLNVPMLFKYYQWKICFILNYCEEIFFAKFLVIKCYSLADVVLMTCKIKTIIVSSTGNIFEWNILFPVQISIARYMLFSD